MRQPYPLTYHKAGDTWDRTQRYTLPAGTWTATSAARTADGELVQTFTCALTTLSEDPDGYTHALNTTATAADTADWPMATLLADVVFVDASATPVKRSSSAFQIASCAYLPEVLDDYTNLAVIPGDMLALVRGEDGPPGEGMPAGGTAGQVLAKASNTNYDLAWVDQTGGGAGATNLAYTASATGGTVTSDTGTDATLPLADGTNAGLMAPAQHTKLAGIAAGATAVTVDAAPTDGSSNAVSSNGVFDALAGKSDTGHNHSGTYDPAGTASSALSAHTGAADPHTQYVLESAVGAAGGVASLDGAGQVPAAQIPAIAITEYMGSVASQSAMLALSGQKGDWCIRTDTGTTWIITGANPALLAGWTELVYPAAPVSSVAGRTGAITLSSADITDTTAAGRALLDDADAAAQRATLGLGDAATKAVGTTAGTVAAGDHTHSGYAGTGAIGSSGLTMATAKLLGRSTASTGAVEEITLGTNLSFSGTTLNAAGGGSPGGSDTQIQFNDGGSSFGGSSNFIFNKTTVKQTLNTGRKQLSFSNDGNDPVISADGAGAVHLWVKGGSQQLYLSSGYGAVISNNDVNQVCYISPSVPNQYIRDATGVGVKPGIGLSTYNVANLYIGACGRMLANDTVATLNIVGQASAATSTSNISGGGINITGGSGASSSSGAASGGSIAISGGVGYGTGTKGIVTASRLRANGFATATAAKTADYTATLDDGTIEVDASGAARTITLFACSANAGKILVIKKTDSSANAVTIDGNASETIDGATTISLASQYSTAILQVNAAGTGWNKLGGV